MNIILAVTGSIAAYKSYDVARGLIKNGHKLKIILTTGALEFVKPELYRYLGAEAVYLPQDDFVPNFLSKNSTVLHIELVKWADKLIIAPLSANTLARLSLGLNNDLLGSVFLAFGNKPILLFPAMNTNMWEQARTQDHIKNLRSHTNIGCINPSKGLLACGDIGAGKFPEVSAVIDLCETYQPGKHSNKTVIVTAGATAAPIDPVRYVTNPSSGKMGLSIAKEFLKEGHQVIVLAGHACTSEVNNLAGHPSFELFQTPTTEAMKNAALKHFPFSDLYISTGAIADIEFKTSDEKIKKEAMTGSLPFHQAADILKEILKIKKPNQKIISFAAETNTSEEVFREKMNRKPVDLMIGNKVSNGLVGMSDLIGFQKDQGEYWLIYPDNTVGPYPLSKVELASKLVHWYQGINP